MENTTVEEIEFNFTGFGAFLDVKENPTMTLIETMSKLKEKNDLGIRIGDCRVLDVSIIACQEYMKEMIKKVEEKSKINPKVKQVFIHLGVYRGSSAIHLEKRGHNEAEFRGPDNSGYTAHEEKIVKIYPLKHDISTIFPIEKLEKVLSEKKHKVEISQDPGRYICNYICYLSLYNFAPKLIPSIFIHVPHFSEISQDKQESFLVDFVVESQKMLLEEFNS